jgi:ribonucleoside-triphosphate reductase (formate)
MHYVIKRNGNKEEFNSGKIEAAILKAFDSCSYKLSEKDRKNITSFLNELENEDVAEDKEYSVEYIQDRVEKFLCKRWFRVGKAYMLYREQHKTGRFIRERLDYMKKYSDSNTNASSASETDSNANVTMKNVANLEGEVYKTTNRIIQRQRMKAKLKELYPEVAEQYEKDLENHIIYTHDEASTPVLKYYCCAVTLYPLMTEGVGNIDGITPTPPNDIQSFSGQITNLAFLLSSQCKGAVAFGDYFVALNYYVVKEFGDHWYDKVDVIITNSHIQKQQTIEHCILKGMKQFIYGVCQPAGNRSYNSPFTNVSWYDKYYFEAMFGDFYYPDGTKPEWKAVDKLQRMFMKLMREIRLLTPITFPVTTMSLLHNDKEFLDKEYEDLCAEEWSKGGSFFCYMNDNPASLASCCRVLNEMSDNTFSSTTGMNGVMTGSCNVITLNLNRIVQNYFKQLVHPEDFTKKEISELYKEEECKNALCSYLISILDRVYKYHIAYKTMLYEMEGKGMFAASNGNYIYMKKLYSTIGLIGYMEAAEFLGLKINNNEEYKNFLKLIFSTVSEQNKLHSIHDKKKPFLMNSEAIPGENLGVKLLEWDKKDGYWTPEGAKRYNCYFFNPWNDKVSILDKIKLHGGDIAKALSGGQAAHLNLDTHLSKEQYKQLMHVAMKNGTNYFTFNIPMSKCKDCNHVVNAPVTECPTCHSTNIKYYTRIIGYLSAVDNWSEAMQKEFGDRYFSDEKHVGLD